jgi:hypothetical protein
MKTIFRLAVLSLFAILPTRSDASAIVVYNNFGAGQSYNPTTGWAAEGPDAFFGPGAVAEPFTPASTVTFDAVLLPLSNFAGTNSVIVSLRPDVGGQPGTTPIESFPLTGISTSPTSTVYQLNSIADPVLNAGTTYWIALFAGGNNTEAAWMFNSTGADQFSSSHDGGNTWFNGFPNTAPAMEVLGNAVATPEPSALAMLAGLGAVACTIGATRMRRKPVAR